MSLPLITLRLNREEDLVAARQRTRLVTAGLGFDAQDQTRLATAVSEIARNAVMYAGGGRIEFSIEGTTAPQLLVIRVTDTGPGIADVNAILQGRYHSTTGMGLGIQGARRLVDIFRIDSSPSGVVVTMQKVFPRRAGVITPRELDALTARLAQLRPESAIEEMQSQNRELLNTLDELRRRSDQLAQLNRELEDTNRGVVALYAELDDKAEKLREADRLKSTFLSHMSHEFRTPLNSIMALSRILLSRLDGPLTAEQEKQVGYITRAAQELTEMVNDLLDLAKVEAGRVELRPTSLSLETLFGTLRGMMRPLVANSPVQLVFDTAVLVPDLFTDESALSQILRNFISNAIKFTEKGEIRVTASFDAATGFVSITVADTGIGIAPEDQARIFEQFTQVESARQRQVKGTGLGLSLSRKLAALLGGEITLRSVPREGSAFTVSIPARMETAPAEADQPVAAAGERIVVLGHADAWTELLARAEYSVSADIAEREVVRMLEAEPARVLILDARDAPEAAWRLLAHVKSAGLTVPVVVAARPEDQRKAVTIGADAFLPAPVQSGDVIEVIAGLLNGSPRWRVLVVDDEDMARYVVRKELSSLDAEIEEARSGAEGLEIARDRPPDVIILDLAMPGMSGFEVLDRLKASAVTAKIPVIIHTSRALSPGEREQLSATSAAIVGKGVDNPRDLRQSVDRLLQRN